LADFDDRAADPEPVADTDLFVRESFDGEVLAETAVDEIRPAKIVLPVAVGSELIDHNGPLLSAVARKIGLPVPSQVQPSREDSPRFRPFPNRGSDRLSLPFHVVWQADID
jgi:hypothetical protein